MPAVACFERGRLRRRPSSRLDVGRPDRGAVLERVEKHRLHEVAHVMPAARHGPCDPQTVVVRLPHRTIVPRGIASGVEAAAADFSQPAAAGASERTSLRGRGAGVLGHAAVAARAEPVSQRRQMLPAN